MAEGNVMDVSATHMSNLSKDDDVLSEAALWREEGREVALATVVKTWGSSPRPVGSHLAIDGDSNFVGSVSGGCVEGAVVTEAQDVIAGGPPKVLDYGVSDEQAWEVGLACGGELKVFLERALPAEILRGLVEDHVAETGSRHGQRLLDNWEVERGRFWQICPKELIETLPHPLSESTAAQRA